MSHRDVVNDLRDDALEVAHKWRKNRAKYDADLDDAVRALEAAEARTCPDCNGEGWVKWEGSAAHGIGVPCENPRCVDGALKEEA